MKNQNPHCANLMPYYAWGGMPARSISAECCISSLETLLSAIDKLYELSLVGGEPFTHKELGVTDR
jgi:hypothetical protein